MPLHLTASYNFSRNYQGLPLYTDYKLTSQPNNMQVKFHTPLAPTVHNPGSDEGCQVNMARLNNLITIGPCHPMLEHGLVCNIDDEVSFAVNTSDRVVTWEFHDPVTLCGHEDVMTLELFY